MQPRRLLVYCAQAILLLGSALAGGVVARQGASATPAGPVVTTLHVAPALQQPAGLAGQPGLGPSGDPAQSPCTPIHFRDASGHRFWLSRGLPGDDRADFEIGS